MYSTKERDSRDCIFPFKEIAYDIALESPPSTHSTTASVCLTWNVKEGAEERKDEKQGSSKGEAREKEI